MLCDPLIHFFFFNGPRKIGTIAFEGISLKGILMSFPNHDFLLKNLILRKFSTDELI